MKHRATFFLLALCYIMNVNARILHRHRHHRKLRGRFPNQMAMGFLTKGGPLWSVTCLTEHGVIPGKMDSNSKLWYTHNGLEFPCRRKLRVIRGRYFSLKGELPKNCRTASRLNDGSSPYYAAVIMTHQGLIPGKATYDPPMAWYGLNGKERKNVYNAYILC